MHVVNFKASVCVRLLNSCKETHSSIIYVCNAIALHHFDNYLSCLLRTCLRVFGKTSCAHKQCYKRRKYKNFINNVLMLCICLLTSVFICYWYSDFNIWPLTQTHIGIERKSENGCKIARTLFYLFVNSFIVIDCSRIHLSLGNLKQVQRYNMRHYYRVSYITISSNSRHFAIVLSFRSIYPLIKISVTVDYDHNGITYVTIIKCISFQNGPLLI